MDEAPTAEEISPLVDRLIEATDGEDINVAISSLVTVMAWLVAAAADDRAEVIYGIKQIKDNLTPIRVIRVWEHQRDIVSH